MGGKAGSERVTELGRVTTLYFSLARALFNFSVASVILAVEAGTDK